MAPPGVAPAREESLEKPKAMTLPGAPEGTGKRNAILNNVINVCI